MGEQLADLQWLPWTVFLPHANWLETLKSHINAIEGNQEKLHLTAEKLFRVCLRLEELRKPKHAGGNHHFVIKRWNRLHRRDRTGWNRKKKMSDQDVLWSWHFFWWRGRWLTWTGSTEARIINMSNWGNELWSCKRQKMDGWINNVLRLWLLFLLLLLLIRHIGKLLVISSLIQASSNWDKRAGLSGCRSVSAGQKLSGLCD